MSEHQHARTLIDDIADYTLKVGKEIGWFRGPLRPGRGRLYMLQHILRNRLPSSVGRPAWMSHCQPSRGHQESQKIRRLGERATFNETVSVWCFGQRVFSDAPREVTCPSGLSRARELPPRSGSG